MIVNKIPKQIPNQSMDERITICIKTFNRPDCCRNLIQSIRVFYPSITILVADDGDVPFECNDANVKIFTMPFDSGLSAGRNLLVASATTPYVIIFDDDFVFESSSKFESALDTLETNEDLDIIGFSMKNQKPYHGCFEKLNDHTLRLNKLESYGTSRNGYKLYHIILNCFIARTAVLRKHKWDEDLKMVEHSEFFWRGRGVLKITYFPEIVVSHKQKRTAAYSKFRNRPHLKQLALEKMGIKSYLN